MSGKAPSVMHGAAIAFLLAAAPASAATRLLFVGINTYAHSIDHDRAADPKFKDLKGAVNDVLLVRGALRTRWNLPVDDLNPAAGCEARRPDGLSITLINGCATRAAVLAAFTGHIRDAAPGDTVFFYYAGHGAQRQDRIGNQATGLNSTIVPADAQPGVVPDIIDTDLRRLIDAAEARGVNVVTVFDSCNSGSATRDLAGGLARAAPSVGTAADGDDITPPPPRAGVPRGYRVAFAAALDGQVAHEATSNGVVNGRYSKAFVEALNSDGQPAYADLAAAVTRNFARLGITNQTPVAEGPKGGLDTLFLGAVPSAARIFRAEAGGSPRSLRLAGGSIAGATPGSIYKVYRSAGDAQRDGAVPLGSGSIASAGFDNAILTLDAPLTAASPDLRAREVRHVEGGTPLKLRIDGGSADQRSAVQRAASGIGTVQMVSPGDAPDYVLSFEPAGLQLRTGSAKPGDPGIGSPITAAATALEAETRTLLIMLSRTFNLLALGTRAAGSSAALGFRHTCIDPDAYKDLPVRGGSIEAVVGERWTVDYTNTADTARYANIIGIGANLQIAPGLITETLLEPGQRLSEDGFNADAPGRNQLLLLLTAFPVDLSALRQDGARSVPRNPLEQVLADANQGRASRSTATAGAWYAEIATIQTVPPARRKEKAACPLKPLKP
ncbi:MAG: caspase family protein [Polymorphobacter sp.]